MDSIELDRRLRIILSQATPLTILKDTQAVVELGFSPMTAFTLVEKVIIEKARTRMASAVQADLHGGEA